MQAQTKVTLVPAKSFHHKPAEEEEKEKEEKQKSTAHLKNVDLPAWYKDKTGAIDVSWQRALPHRFQGLLCSRSTVCCQCATTDAICHDDTAHAYVCMASSHVCAHSAIIFGRVILGF
jgi:hypothetical protein